jgi:signal transduction histidine kinase
MSTAAPQTLSAQTLTPPALPPRALSSHAGTHVPGASAMSSQSQPRSVHPDHAKRIEELGRIILAYSEITDKLQKSHNQLTATVQSLRQELSEKNQQLERRNRLAALGEMAAGMAHEIRNPLGGIQLYASMLAKDMEDRPASLSVVRKISGGVKRLEALVSQVLQFTREIVANPAPMELRAAIDEAVELAQQQLQTRGVVCEVSGPPTLMVDLDPLLMGQAMLNLVLNAAEAIEGGGRIRISYAAPPAASAARQCHLIFHDDGPGISPAVLDRIFNPFFTTKESGTGLGLAIVHRVVEAHEGTITVTNPGEGGARFEIRI